MSNLHNEIGSVRDDAATTPGVVTCPSCRTRWRVARGAATGLRCRCSRCDVVFSAGEAKTPYRVRLATDRFGADAPAGVVGGAAPADAAVAPRRRDLRVGMDDPSLAGRLGRTALHGGADRKAWTWTVVAGPEVHEDRSTAAPDAGVDDPAPVVAVACEATIVEAGEPGPGSGAGPSVDAPPAGPASLRESPLEPLIEALDGASAPEPDGSLAVAAAATVDEIPEVVHDDDVAEPTDADAEPGTGGERSRRPGVGAAVVVALLGAAGAMAAWTWTPWLTAAATDVLARWPATAGAHVPDDPSFWAAPGGAIGLLLGWGWLRWTLRRR